MNKFSFILLILMASPLSLVALEKPHHQLGWLGFLHLPEKQLKTSRVVDVKKPKLWKQWDANVVQGLDWLPQSEGSVPLISKGYIITFPEKKPDATLKTRRNERAKSF